MSRIEALRELVAAITEWVERSPTVRVMVPARVRMALRRASEELEMSR
jgi:hypothetical protein